MAGNAARHPQVVVTGVGAVTPVGADAESTWASVLSGRSSTRRLTDPWAEELPVPMAAPVDLDLDALSERIDPAAARTQDRSAHLALAAAAEAWQQAELHEVDPDRLAVAVGTGIGGISSVVAAEATLRDRGPRRVSPWTVPAIMPNGPAAAIGLRYDARAGVRAPVSACASGAEAIALALDLIRAGRADVVIAGGTEAAVSRLPLAAFAAMRALSSRTEDPAAASRPFDKQRDGFVLGEGAAVVVLESAEHAARRGATVLGHLLGAGITNDAHHVAAPEPTGRGAAQAVRVALHDASLTPDDIDHVNAHATSTPAGDLAEARALRASLGPAIEEIPVTATKSVTGHLLGAAGALEAVLCLQTLRDSRIPPIRNLDDPDDDVGLDLVRIEPRATRGPAAVSTSFGFGGHNVALVLGAAR